MINETYKIERRRLFLIQDLPEPLTRASRHLQIFDNYIDYTSLRLRSVRSPETKQWNWFLEKRLPVAEDDLSIWKVSAIDLSDVEHTVFEQFEGREISKNERVGTNEIRKNRYFYDFNDKQYEFDVFLGELWGLNIVKIAFETIEEMQGFQIPSFAILEITNAPFFIEKNLIGKTFSDVQSEFNRNLI